MKRCLAWIALLLAGIVMGGCQSGGLTPVSVGSEVQPIPPATLASGETFDLASAVESQPTVILFYRGGWCQYCIRQLREAKFAHQPLTEMGYQVFAVTPDRPEKVAEISQRLNLPFPILSDSDMEVAKAFGVEMRVPDETYQTWKDIHYIDLEEWSGREHHLVPASSVFVLDAGGTVRFQRASREAMEIVPQRELIRIARDSRPGQ
jgi:peroxiredoxin